MTDRLEENKIENSTTPASLVGRLVMHGFIVLSRNTSATWSGPVYFLQEKNGPRFGECYTQEKATIVSRQRFDELKEKRIIPKNAEFVPVA